LISATRASARLSKSTTIPSTLAEDDVDLTPTFWSNGEEINDNIGGQ